MIGDIRITDKDGNPIPGIVTSAMLPLKFEMETSFGGKNFKLTYSHARDGDGRRLMDKIKGVVLTGN